MKLRVRCRCKTVVIEVDDDTSTLAQLKCTVADRLQIIPCDDFFVSLNGQTPLASDNSNEMLSNLGIVSGDLIHILLPSSFVNQSDVVASASSCSLSAAPSHRPPTAPSHSPSTAPSHSPSAEPSYKPPAAPLCTWSATSSYTQSAATPCSQSTATSCSQSATTSYSQTAISEHESPDESCAASGDASMEISGSKTTEDCTDVTILSQDEATLVNLYLNEPTLVRESAENCIPQSLIRTYSVANPTSSHGALAVVLHVLMAELGFRSVDAIDKKFKDLNENGSFQMRYSYPWLDDATFLLLFVPMQTAFMAHGFAKLTDGRSTKLRLQLSISEFVNMNISGDSRLTYKGSSLPKLSRLFKDTVACPLLQFALRESGMPMLPELSTLFFDVQLHIMKFLDVRSLLSLSQVSHDWHNMTREPVLWRRLYLKDFGCQPNMNLTLDWISIYKERYIHKKRMQRECRQRFLPHPLFGRPYPPVMQPHAGFRPPFVIGGDYDLFPNIHNDPFAFPSTFSSSRVKPRTWPSDSDMDISDPLNNLHPPAVLPSEHRNSTSQFGRSFGFPRFF